MKSQSQVVLSIFLCLVGLGILAVGGTAVIVCVPRSTPEAEPFSASLSVIEDVRRGAPGNRVPPNPIPSTVDEGAADPRQPDEGAAAAAPPVMTTPPAIEGAERGDKPEKTSWTGSPGPAISSSGPGSTEKKRAAPGTSEPERHSATSEQWRIGSVSAEARVFLLDGVDRAATHRPFFAAPPDRRYAVISGSLTWEGSQPHRIRLGISPQGPPTIQLVSDGQTYNPIGRLATRLDPLAPLTTEPITVARQETVALVVAYLVPNDTETVSLVLDGEDRVSFNLPPPAQSRVDDLPGVWQKVERQLRPLRHDDPLVNAVAAPECRLLRIAQNKAGLSELTIPSASVIGVGLTYRDDVGAIQLTLTHENRRQPGWVRVIGDGASLVLYAGDDPGAVFLFERKLD